MPIEWREKYHEWDQYYRIEDDGTVVAASYMDAAPVLEQAKAEHNAGFGSTKDGTFKKVASIPLGVWLEWKRQGVDILQNGKEGWLRRKLDDPEYQHLRVWKGRLGKYHLE
jgi:hypothetical protein